ncbi:MULTISPECIES: RNA polymerase sigma factor [Niastella]|uniref:Sigma-70 family RNA polymerase sigma factor n=1 Tax=Niastella soli TaxID=2821487 RepID=A0ABS3Z3F7_9BACT|nr:sigma-70 family RNA polymerase sigma factor [Niastella soli]MBO9204691.1 sigma-70 family RNA polymerase sigma factor [Niastella soli]
MKNEPIDEVVFLHGINCRDRIIAYEFYKLVFPKLCWAANDYLNDEHYAWDVVTAVFDRFMEEKETYGTLSHVEAVLYKRVCWASLDRLKALKRDKSNYGTSELDVVSDEEASIEDLIVKAEYYNLIREAMKTLPDNYSFVLEELFLKGTKSDEVARLLNTTNNAVYIIKNRALKRMYQILKDKSIIIILLLFFPPT